MIDMHKKIKPKYKERKQVPPPTRHNLKWVLPIFGMVGSITLLLFLKASIIPQG